MPDPSVFYWSISVLTSRTMWWNFANLVVSGLSLSEVYVLIPPKYIPIQVAVVAFVNMWLRTQTVRPVSFIMPGSTSQVEVPRIGPPPPAPMTD